MFNPRIPSSHATEPRALIRHNPYRANLTAATIRAALLSSTTVMLATPAALAQVEFTWSIIGHAGNEADTVDGDRFTPGVQRYGAVGYSYRVATTEVTNEQYVEFLNAVARIDPHGLFNGNMSSDAHSGIERSGSPGSYYYSVVPGRGDDPVVYVSFLDAVRFINWMHNGQGQSDTEFGAYDIVQGIPGPRRADARYFIPDANEWYKAAYHQPALDGGDSDGFWKYPTTQNNAPLGGVDANFDMTLSDTSSVGAFGTNYYGLSDMAGNVWEWSEEQLSSSVRVIRGGSWGMSGSYLLPYGWMFRAQTGENNSIGFRIAAATPVPSCPGDIDESGTVDASDLNALLAAWQAPVDIGSSLDVANDDGMVDVDDLIVLLNNLGLHCD